MGKRVYGTTLMVLDGDHGRSLTPHQNSEFEAWRHSFRQFLCYLHLRNRETGATGIVGGNRRGRALVLLSREYLERGA